MRRGQLLFSLPSDLVGSAVLSKLSVLELVLLDAAVLEKGFRSELFSCYRAVDPINLVKLFPEGVKEAILDWFLRRNMKLGDVAVRGAELVASKLLADNVEYIQGRLVLQVEDRDRSWGLLTNADSRSTAVQSKCDTFEVCDTITNKYPVAGGLTAAIRLPFRNLASIVWSAHPLLDDCLAALIVSNLNMRSIQLDCGVESFAPVTAALTTRKDTLRKLDLGYVDVTDGDLLIIASTCVSLTSFDVVILGVDLVTTAGVNAIILGCPLLESIGVEYDHYVTQTTELVTSACTHGRNLSSIRIIDSLFCDEALQARQSSCTPLRELHCSWGVTSLGTVESLSQILCNLSTIHISCMTESSTDTFQAALSRMPMLREVNFGQYDRAILPTAALQAVADNCALLNNLCIEAHVEVGVDRALASIVCNNPNLVELTGATKLDVTDAVVIALAAHCPGLRRFHLSCAESVTDAAVIALARGCPALTYVALGGNAQMTEGSILALARHCRSLRDLHLKSITKLTYASVVAIERNHRKLKITLPPRSPQAQLLSGKMKAMKERGTIEEVGSACGCCSILV